jgi:glycosyltransferase involved in cell wall biosynthesis
LGERWSFGLFALPKAIRERYDIVHIHKPFDLPLGVIIRKKTGSKLILGSHGTDFFPGDKIFGRRVDGIVACSAFNGRQVEERYGVAPRIIYNGIDPEIFRPVSPNLALQRQLGLLTANRIIVFTGRLIGLKGVGDLLRALAGLSETYPWQLLVIGEGESRVALQKLSDGLGIGRRVIFTGFVPNDELPHYYASADLAVFPSVADETFGVAICEAMACGRAVVSTWVGGIPELVIHGEAGLLARPRDPADLGIKISRLLREDDLRRHLGEAALRRVRRLFTWEKVADRLQQVYNAVMEGEKPTEQIQAESLPLLCPGEKEGRS